jgi:indole-3-glycerol phosphate synthase/phosphoribosylanthranilate isomerase
MRKGRPQQQKSSRSSTRVLLVVLVTLFSNVSSFVSQPRRPLVAYSSMLTATRAPTDASSPTAASPPYTDTQLAEALESLLKGSAQPAHDARHISGHGDAAHELSMLQRITATRILDYRDDSDVAAVSLADWEGRATAFGEAHGSILNLQTVIQSLAPRMALAAEFKRASPSKGAIALDVVAGEQAQVYAAAGANIISILTESRWFQGSLADMQEARLATNDNSPLQRPAILRKDFITSPVMIAEAAAHGADTILLIVAVTPQHLLEQLIDYSRSLGMEPLVEVHANVELDVALQAGAKVIGVNNRNLHTFEMDLSTSERVAEQLTERGLTFAHETTASADYSLCALSGMSTAADVHRYRQAGLGMCLIGESLMRAADAGAAIRSLCLHPDDYEQQAASLAAGGAYTGGCQLVKVCGLTRPEDALVACRAGANLIGVIFAPKSKRCVTVEQAKAVVETVRTFGERRQRIDVAATNMASPLASLATSAQSLAQAARRPLVVGVFQNQEPEFVRQMVEECGLDLVQLHGSEGFAAANREACGVPAIRVVDIVVDPATGLAAENAVERIIESLTSDPVAVLLDTAIKGHAEGGGTSTTFDWSIAERLQAQGLPVLIAGGLTAETIGDCAGNTRPLGVDVSSGVEVSPGIKNPDQVTAFVQNAKEAAQEARKGF